MNKILVLGSLNMDLVINTSKIPDKGETIKGNNFFTCPGGKGANQAVSCAKQEKEVYMIGCVGSDFNGGELVNSLNKCNVKTDYIKKLDNISTGVAMIILSDCDNRIIISSGANEKITIDEVKEAIDEIASCGDVLVVQMEIPLNIIEFGLRYAKEKGIFTILNPSPAQKLSKDILEKVDLVVANESETQILTNINISNKDDLCCAFKKYSNLGVKNVIITLGDKGSCTFLNNEIIYVNSFKVNAVDTTAAGDTYLGTLATQIIDGNNLVDSMKYASCASAIAVTRLGAQNSIPTKKEVDEFLMKK